MSFIVVFRIKISISSKKTTKFGSEGARKVCPAGCRETVSKRRNFESGKREIVDQEILSLLEIFGAK
jgi:hypothetical protein